MNSRTSIKERTGLQKTFYLDSIHVNEGKCSEMMPEEFHIYKNMFLTGDPDEIHAGEKSEDSSLTKNSLSYPQHPVSHQMTQTLQQPFEFTEQGRAFNKEKRFFTHRRTLMGETACKHRGTVCDNLAVIAQERSPTGERCSRCNEWREIFLEKPIELIFQRYFNDEHKYNQSGSYISKKLQLYQLQREKKFEYNISGKTVKVLFSVAIRLYTKR